MIELGVNIDHVASLRQARYRDELPGGGPQGEPDPVRLATEAELGGADCITVHLREDRRHIHDRDVQMLRPLVRVRFNLEMAATDEMVGVALQHKVHMCTLVPEGRNEVTTEGGLDVAAQATRLKEVVRKLHNQGIVVSAFVDAEPAQIESAAACGFDCCEIHTGPYARAFAEHGGSLREKHVAASLDRVADAGRRIRAAGMKFNAGHALNYVNVRPIAALPGIGELHIGHSIISRAMYVGVRQAVREMKDVMLSAGA